MRTILSGLFLVSCTLTGVIALDSRAQPPSPAQLRHPVALALSSDGQWLFAANQRGGTISVIDARSLKRLEGVSAGRRLADLQLTPDGKYLLTVDEEAGELLVFRHSESMLKLRQRVPVQPGPVRVAVNPEGTLAFVASLWARQLTRVSLAEVPAAAARHFALPITPRHILHLPDSGILVLADAFGGQLVLFDVLRGAVDSIRTLPAHNIRGLALSPDRKMLLVAHQVLHRLGETTRDNVHWGNVITNNLRAVQVANLLNPRAELLRDSRLHQIGEAGRGSGDPSGVAVTAEGTHLVTLGGVGDVAVGPDKLGVWQRLKVGRRPTAVVTSPDGRRAYVANTFADSIAVLDVQQRCVIAEISLGEQPALTARDRGEHLFYDARLAHDGWLSCHSCHTDGHTNGLLSDTLGDNSFGAPKRVLSLLGVKDTAPYAWNGSVPDLESQIRKSVTTTMYGPTPTDEQVRDLAAYLRTLAPPPGRKQEADQLRRGQAIFEKQGCGNCHPAPAYTSGKTYDVGLKDEVGNRLFNPPSLRGVGQGTAFFHDARATQLEDVFIKHRHQLKGDLQPAELRDLLAFLRGL